MGDPKQAFELLHENDPTPHDDCTDTLDFAAVLLELRDSFSDFREEVRRELRTIRMSTDLACQQLKGFGLRLRALERSQGQVEADVLALASGTPPPTDFIDDTEYERCDITEGEEVEP